MRNGIPDKDYHTMYMGEIVKVLKSIANHAKRKLIW